MLNGTYYLNNTGSRWVVYENGVKPTFYVKDKNGNYHLRTAIFFESFGNFASCTFSWKGHKISALPADTEQHEEKMVVCERDTWPQSSKKRK